jgi:hypothetical protein
MAGFNQASRKIGNASVSPIGFGVMGISRAYSPVGSDEDRFKVRNQYMATTLRLPAISSYVLYRYLMLPTSMVAHTGTPLMHMAIPKSLLANGAFKVLLLPLHLCEYSRIRFGRTGNRKEIFLASKFGVTYNPETGRGGDKEYVKEAANRSLQRLGVDMIILSA